MDKSSCPVNRGYPPTFPSPPWLLVTAAGLCSLLPCKSRLLCPRRGRHQHQAAGRAGHWTHVSSRGRHWALGGGGHCLVPGPQLVTGDPRDPLDPRASGGGDDGGDAPAPRPLLIRIAWKHWRQWRHGLTINHDYTFSPQMAVHYPADINTYRGCRIRIQTRNVDTAIIPPCV